MQDTDPVPMTLRDRFINWAKFAGIGLAAVLVSLAIGDSSPVELAALIVFGYICFLALRYPLVGLALLIFMIASNLSSNMISGFGAPSAAKLAAPGLFALLGARFLIWGDRPYVAWLGLLMVLGLVALKLFGATYASDWGRTLDETVDFIKVAILALLATAFMSYRRGFETIIATMVLTIAVVCSLGLMQLYFLELPGGFDLFSRFSDTSGRFTGTIEDENFFSVFVVFCMPCAIVQLLNARRHSERLLWALALAMLVFGLLATQSRGGLISLSFSLLILFCYLSPRQKLTAAAGLGIFAFMALPIFGPELIDRYATIADVFGSGGVDRSTEGRLASWTVAAELFKTNPWMGVGAGNFEVHYQDIALKLGMIFRGEGRATHSLWLEYLAEQGVVGLSYILILICLAAASIFAAYKDALASGDKRLAGLFAGFGAGLGGYLFGMTFLQESYPRFLWIMLILGIEAGRIARVQSVPGGTGNRTAPARKPPLLLTNRIDQLPIKGGPAPAE